MLQSRFTRVVVSAVVAGSAVAALSMPGFATAAAKVGIACKSLTGNETSTMTFTKCTGNTGKASKPMQPFPHEFTALNWKNGKTTIVHTSFDIGDDSRCAPGSSAFEIGGKTTSDTTGSAKIGGKVRASICVDAALNITLVPGTKLKIA